jgi:hypothetical protein
LNAPTALPQAGQSELSPANPGEPIPTDARWQGKVRGETKPVSARIFDAAGLVLQIGLPAGGLAFACPQGEVVY